MTSPARLPHTQPAPTRRIAGQRTRPTQSSQAVRGGSGTATPEGSATQTLTSAPTQPDGLVLRLRGHTPSPVSEETTDNEGGEGSGTRRRRRIQWAEDVIDNEGLGRKKSKVCCIFHKNKPVGESSSEEDSSSSDDSDASPSDDDGAARPAGGGRGRRKGRRQEHNHKHNHDEGCGDGGHRKPSPNAYERIPKYDVKPLERQPGR